MPQLDGAVRTKMRDELGLNNKDCPHCAIDGQENRLLDPTGSGISRLDQVSIQRIVRDLSTAERR
jgi:hypothetical protein